MEREWTIQEAADEIGITPHTLRYYEKAGLLVPVSRNVGGHRRYSQREIDFLLFLTRLRSMGMPIQQVKKYAELARQGKDTTHERGQLLFNYRKEVCSRISELERNLKILDYKIGLYRQGWSATDGDDPCIRELRQLCTLMKNQEESIETEKDSEFTRR